MTLTPSFNVRRDGDGFGHAVGASSWPALPAGYILQVTASLTEPVVWQSDVSARVQENGFFKVTVPLTGTNRYYRLVRP